MSALAEPLTGDITDREILGLWKRAYIKAPAENPAHEDHETRVYWFQAPELYADLRVPAEFASGFGGAALKDLDCDTLFRLGKCEGFAGISTVEDSVCTWRRFINLQGPEDGKDIGRLSHAPDGMYEHGVEADFVEATAGLAAGLADRRRDRLCDAGCLGRRRIAAQHPPRLLQSRGVARS